MIVKWFGSNSVIPRTGLLTASQKLSNPLFSYFLPEAAKKPENTPKNECFVPQMKRKVSQMWHFQKVRILPSSFVWSISAHKESQNVTSGFLKIFQTPKFSLQTHLLFCSVIYRFISEVSSHLQRSEEAGKKAVWNPIRRLITHSVYQQSHHYCTDCEGCFQLWQTFHISHLNFFRWLHALYTVSAIANQAKTTSFLAN